MPCQPNPRGRCGCPEELLHHPACRYHEPLPPDIRVCAHMAPCGGRHDNHRPRGPCHPARLLHLGGRSHRQARGLAFGDRRHPTSSRRSGTHAFGGDIPPHEFEAAFEDPGMSGGRVDDYSSDDSSYGNPYDSYVENKSNDDDREIAWSDDENLDAESTSQASDDGFALGRRSAGISRGDKPFSGAADRGGVGSRDRATPHEGGGGRRGMAVHGGRGSLSEDMPRGGERRRGGRGPRGAATTREGGDEDMPWEGGCRCGGREPRHEAMTWVWWTPS